MTAPTTSEIEDAGFSIEDVPEDDLELGTLDDDDDDGDDDSFRGLFRRRT